MSESPWEIRRREERIESARILAESLGHPTTQDLLDMADGLEAEIVTEGRAGIATTLMAVAMLRAVATPAAPQGAEGE